MSSIVLKNLENLIMNKDEINYLLDEKYKIPTICTSCGGTGKKYVRIEKKIITCKCKKE